MSRPNLPQLVADASIATPPKPGEWVSQNVSLDKLAESLKLPSVAMRSAEVRSIPDIWAQVLSFGQALAQPAHPLRGEALAQWRALLATFALAEAYAKHYQIELRPVELGLGEPVRSSRRAGDLLRATAGRLPPRERLPQAATAGAAVPASAEWDRPILVYVRGQTPGAGDAFLSGPPQLVGLMNPGSLLAAGKTAGSVRIDTAPWLRHGLKDPTRLPLEEQLSRAEYMLVAAFLQGLRASLDGLAAAETQNTAYRTVRSLLEEFEDRCHTLADGYDRPMVRDASRTSRVNLPPLYQALMRAPSIAPTAFPVGYSDCALKLRTFPAAPASPVFKGVILYDPELAATLRSPPQDVHVWRQHTLKHLDKNLRLLEEVRREAEAEGYLLVQPQDFFTAEFVRLSDGDVVQAHPADGAFRSAVLPLSPLALLVHAGRDLVRQVRGEAMGDGSHLVTLDLPLLPEKAGVHRIVRRFDADAPPGGFNTAERVNAQFGLISTWPDFSHPAWRWNFLKLSYNPQMTGLQARFGISGQHLVETLAGAGEGPARASAARAWFDSSGLRAEVEDAGLARPVTPAGAAGPLQRLRYLAREDLVEELQIAASPFEAVCLARKRSAAETHARPVGLVLLSYRRVEAPAPEATHVAVDFGTTNTVACTGTGEPIRFGSRIGLPITQPASEAANRRDFKWSFVDFFPLRDYPTPIPTVAKQREIDAEGDAELRKAAAGRDERALFSDMIFFQPPLGESGANHASQDLASFKSTQRRLLFNLKWSEDPLGRDVARRFLRQVMLMTSAELFAGLDPDRGGSDPAKAIWHFSYPEAMKADDVRDFEANVRRAWSELFGTDPEVSAATAVLPLVSEAAATANYFLNNDQSGHIAGPLTIVLDVGGRTTDIAILSESRLCWRGSFALAGGDFVTHFLINNVAYFDHIGLADLAELRRAYTTQASSLYPQGQGAEEQLKSFGELLFSSDRFRAAIDERYSVVNGTPEGKGLRHSAWVFLGGLAFYLGMVVRGLDATRPDLHLLENAGRLTFALGGRGATLFKRYQTIAGSQPSALTDLLGLFFVGAGLEPEAYPQRGVMSSPQAKMEVVAGMVSNPDTLQRLGQPAAAAWIPLGERLAIRAPDGRGALDALEDSGGLRAASEVPFAEELPQFREFLKQLSRLTGVDVDLREDAPAGAYTFVRKKVTDSASSYLNACRRLRDTDAPPAFEPPFITALRALLDRVGRPLSERAAYLELRDR